MLMQVNLYLDGEITPIAYDYGMDLDGVLTPSPRLAMRSKGICLVVLQRGAVVPTARQQDTINTIQTINPNWDVRFFFQRSPARATN